MIIEVIVAKPNIAIRGFHFKEEMTEVYEIVEGKKKVLLTAAEWFGVETPNFESAGKSK